MKRLKHLVAGAALIALSCGDPGQVTDPTSGSLEITTITSGPQPDGDGYAVTIEGVTETNIAASATIRRDNLEPGIHTVQLTSVATNCTVADTNPRAVTVAAAQKTTTTFSVLCPNAVPYRATDLGTLPSGKYSTATDINSAGQVVGLSEVSIARGATWPFLWENGVMIALLQSPLDEFHVGSAAAINPAGQVVGVSGGVNSHARFPWTWAQGVMNNFASREGRATDINPTGQVVGAVNHLPEYVYNDAFLWDNGTLTVLGSLTAGKSTEAYGIDAVGRVVGQSDGHAFLWEDRVMTDLNIPGGESIARRINGAGQVVGEVRVDGVTHGFIWQDGVTTDLGEVVQVNDINASGQVVGSRIVEGTEHAFVWENGIMTNLPGPSRAFGINDEGQIVGDAGHNGLTRPSRATLWTPE